MWEPPLLWPLAQAIRKEPQDTLFQTPAAQPLWEAEEGPLVWGEACAVTYTISWPRLQRRRSTFHSSCVFAQGTHLRWEGQRRGASRRAKVVGVGTPRRAGILGNSYINDGKNLCRSCFLEGFLDRDTRASRRSNWRQSAPGSGNDPGSAKVLR